MKQKFYDFLKKVDYDFPTPLSDRVDLMEYASKLADKATVSAVFDNQDILAMVAMYCNDVVTGFAYVPMVAVVPKARGRKLSKALMKCAIQMARDNGFKTIGIHTENPVALHLYESLGFVVIEGEERKYLELKL